jgi:ABC-type Na+ efflux pump permease subunit
VLLVAYHHGAMPDIINPSLPGAALSQPDAFRALLLVLLLLELSVIVLVAVYLSAGSISREREDGTLDLLLTTPVTPRQYLWGKLRGLVSFLSLLLAAPLLTVAGVCAYSLVGAKLHWPQATPAATLIISGSAVTQNVPLLLPEVCLWLPLILVPFVALCVAIGMNWSMKARGVLGAVIPSVLIVGVMALVLGVCGLLVAQHVPYVGPFINAFSPATHLIAMVNPWDWVQGFADDPVTGRIIMAIGGMVAAVAYSAIVYLILQGLVRSFDQAVRRLSGAGA